MLKSTPFYTGFPTNVNDQSTYWSTVDGAGITEAVAKNLVLNPQILSPGRSGDYRSCVIRICGTAEDQVINYRVSSLSKHTENAYWAQLLVSGTATVGTCEVGGSTVFKNNAGASLAMLLCDTMTVSVSAYATAMQNMMDITNGINVHSPTGNAIAELLIPDCFGTDLLVALQPNSAAGTYVNYLARVIR